MAAFVTRWRLAIALGAGSLAGGVSLEILHASPNIASAVAAGVSAGLFYGLRNRSSN